MHSSISPFKTAWPKRAAAIVMVMLLGMAASVWYTIQFNPEVVHFSKTHMLKLDWARKMNREHGAKLVVFGGSSCEFSIDGERLLQNHNLPCANLGRGAGMGPVVLTMAAMEETRPGDTLIIAMEPALLTSGLDTPNLGIQFSVAAGHWNWLREPLAPVKPKSWAEILLALRPGGFHMFTMLGKWARGGPLYRYQVSDMHPSGWNQTPVRLPISGPPGHSGRLPEDSVQFLSALRDWCAQRNVRVAYSLPWAYTPPDKMMDFQKKNAQLLIQIAQILPVLLDAKLGAYSVREHFSDTAWHLIEEAAALRTDELGNQISQWQLWTAEALQQKVGALSTER